IFSPTVDFPEPETPITMIRSINSSYACGHAAIDMQDLSVHKSGSIAAQEYGGTDQFFHIPPAARRRPFFQPSRKFGVINQCLIQRRLEIARCNRIDLQAMSGPIGGHTARQVADSSLCRGIRRNRRTRQFTLNRSNVDYLAASSRDHIARSRLPRIKSAGDVGFQKLLPFLDWEILKRCAVLY